MADIKKLHLNHSTTHACAGACANVMPVLSRKQSYRILYLRFIHALHSEILLLDASTAEQFRSYFSLFNITSHNIYARTNEDKRNNVDNNANIA